MNSVVNTPAFFPAKNSSMVSANYSSKEALDYSMDPVALAHLDFNLFKSLRKLGVSRERLCSALCISYEDYFYLCELEML
ncbi:MAG: hypothetical protein V7720_04140 [Halioglobus sp.]